jgi:hypothetical protein
MLDPMFQLQVWPGLSDQQRLLHLAVVYQYQALGGHAFHKAPNATEGAVFSLPDGTRLCLMPEDLALDLKRLRQDRLIDCEYTGGTYVIRPTPDGIALTEAVQRATAVPDGKPERLPSTQLERAVPSWKSIAIWFLSDERVQILNGANGRLAITPSWGSLMAGRESQIKHG